MIVANCLTLRTFLEIYCFPVEMIKRYTTCSHLSRPIFCIASSSSKINVCNFLFSRKQRWDSRGRSNLVKTITSATLRRRNPISRKRIKSRNWIWWQSLHRKRLSISSTVIIFLSRRFVQQIWIQQCQCPALCKVVRTRHKVIFVLRNILSKNKRLFTNSGLVHWMSAVMAEHITSNTHHDPAVGMHYMWNGSVDVSFFNLLISIYLHVYGVRDIFKRRSSCVSVMRVKSTNAFVDKTALFPLKKIVA